MIQAPLATMKNPTPPNIDFDVSEDATNSLGSETPVKVLYIAGQGRNGGTLLDRVLGDIDGFWSMGEFKFVFQKGLIDNELCNCGAPFRECPFWNGVLNDASIPTDTASARDVVGLYRSVDRTRYLPALLSAHRPNAFAKRLSRYADILARLHLSCARRSGARVLVNSSKFAGYALVLAQSPLIDLHVLHLVRDSRAVAFSWGKTVTKPEVTEGSAHLKRYGTASTAVQWLYRNLAAEQLERPGILYRRLRYEDFAKRPKETVADLAAWVDETDANLPFLDDRTVNLGPSHTQSGNPMRFREGKIPVRLDDEWQRALAPGPRRLVTLITAPLLARYGYLGD